MFDKNLQDFLYRNGACADGIDRLQASGVETLEQAWEKASDEDLIWAVTREGVMSLEQRRLFLVMVLESIEDKLTDSRSLNILTKLRTNEPITDDDRNSAWAATAAARAEAAAARAAAEAARAAWFAASEEARAAQAKWVRENFKLQDLHTK